MGRESETAAISTRRASGLLADMEYGLAQATVHDGDEEEGRIMPIGVLMRFYEKLFFLQVRDAFGCAGYSRLGILLLLAFGEGLWRAHF